MPPTPGKPWLFDYIEDLTVGSEERQARLGNVPLRPVLKIGARGVHEEQYTYGLVDSGSEHTLLPPWMGRAAGIFPSASDPELPIGLGGSTRLIRFTQAQLVLPPPPEDPDDEPAVWDTQVGVIKGQWEPPWMLLGQVGFFDHFTVAMNRHAQMLAVEALDEWDERYGVRYQTAR